MTSPVNFAVIGCGLIARGQHIPNIVRSEKAVLHTCCDGSCPPARVYSAYNTLSVENKKIRMEPRDGHGITPDRQAMERDCILRGLGFE